MAVGRSEGHCLALWNILKNGWIVPYLQKKEKIFLF
jgi:hypothetical protein